MPNPTEIDESWNNPAQISVIFKFVINPGATEGGHTYIINCDLDMQAESMQPACKDQH
jgi:hypothetical protein